MKRYRIIVRTFEDNERSPSVTHVLHGRTQKEAHERLETHLRDDRFLRDCLEGRIPCRNEVFMEDVMTGERWKLTAEDLEAEDG